MYPLTRSITAYKFTSSWPPSASPNSLDHGLGVYLWVNSNVIFRRTSNCSEALPAASPDIQCVDSWLYRYMRIQTEYMSFDNRWTISTSNNFQVHEERSPTRWRFPSLLYSDSTYFEVLPGLSWALPGLSSVLTDLSLVLPGASRCTQSSLWRSKMFSKFSQSLPWYSSTSHQRFQLLRRPAVMPSYGLILSWNWRI